MALSKSNQKAIKLLEDTLLELYGDNFKNKITHRIGQVETELEQSGVEFDAANPKGNQLLLELVADGLYEAKDEVFLARLKAWIKIYAEIKNAPDKLKDFYAQERQQYGINSNLALGNPVDSIWGDENDIRLCLKGIMIDPVKINQSGIYILPPVSLVPPSASDSSPEERKDPSSFLRNFIKDALQALEKNKVTDETKLVVPVNRALNHWLLAEIIISDGEIRRAGLWDPLSSGGKRRDTVYQNLKDAVSGFKGGLSHTEYVPYWRGEQKNGHSCVDYCIREALIRKYPENDQTFQNNQPHLAAIRNAENDKALRDALVARLTLTPKLTGSKIKEVFAKEYTEAVGKELLGFLQVQTQLRNDFDEEMAKELNSLYQKNPNVVGVQEENKLVEEARKNTFNKLRPLFFTQPETKAGKEVITHSKPALARKGKSK